MYKFVENRCNVITSFR